MRPAILYKYRADGEFTEKIITSGEVWLPVAEDLNDPFECQTGIIPEDWKQKVILENEHAQLMGAILGPGLRPVETLFSLDKRQTRRWLKALARVPHREKMARMRKLYRDHGIILSDPARMFDGLEQQLGAVGIFSLSEVGDDQLMWAHYGANHTGVTFGFAVEEGSRLADPAHLLEVIYADEKPVFTDGYLREVRISADGNGGKLSQGRFSMNDPVFRASITTKPIAWAYEREWRYIHERAGGHKLPARIKSVTFGLRMLAERKSFYSNLLRDRGYEVELLEARQVVPGKLAVVPSALSRKK